MTSTKKQVSVGEREGDEEADGGVLKLGKIDGANDGNCDGYEDALGEREVDGDADGDDEGLALGEGEGAPDGVCVGML